MLLRENVTATLIRTLIQSEYQKYKKTEHQKQAYTETVSHQNCNYNLWPGFGVPNNQIICYFHQYIIYF